MVQDRGGAFARLGVNAFKTISANASPFLFQKTKLFQRFYDTIKPLNTVCLKVYTAMNQ